MSRKTDAHTLIVLLVLALVAAFCTLSLPAHATGKPETPSSPSSTSSAGSTSGARASAGSKSGAKASSGSTSSTGDVSQGLTTGDDRSRFLSLALAPLAFTPQMAPVHVEGCAPQITQHARGLLWGAGSDAGGTTDTSACTLLHIRNAKVEACQYGSAKQIEDLLVAKLLPGFVASPAGDFVDLSRQACAALKAPPVTPSGPQNLVAAAPEPSRSSAASATEPCPAAAPAARPTASKRATGAPQAKKTCP